MMMLRVTAALAVLMLAGCATNRGTMALAVPEAAVSKSDGTPVFIDEIVDHRQFEEKPSDPSIPSLKGGASNASAEVKARAIARKRNSYGMALGDIVLEGDQTVVGVTRDLLRESLTDAGYTVVTDRGALGDDGLEIDVRIDRFWAWFTPGMWAVKMEVVIDTALTIAEGGDTRSVDIKAYAINKGQSGREGNWMEAYRRAFEDYKAKARSAF